MESTEQVIAELKQEKAELSAKIEKLEKFLKSENFLDKFGEHHAFLLQRQLYSMGTYSFWLGERIEDLEGAE